MNPGDMQPVNIQSAQPGEGAWDSQKKNSISSLN
jgi:hypothetical protein